MCIPILEVEGYEADDVIGTLARQAEAAGMTTYMMTPDKDYGQLVTERTLMYRPALKGRDFELRGVAEVCGRYGIESTSQVKDLLALEGDVSDNVPGCPGVGEKTAAKLIARWGSVENLLEHADEIKGALGNNIRANAEQIRFSKYLVTIKTDVPLDISVEGLRRREPDLGRLREIYRGLEFRTLLAGLESPAEGAAPGAGAARPTASQRQAAEAPSLFDFADAEEARETEIRTTSAVASAVPVADAEALVGFGKRAEDADRIAIAVIADGEDAMSARLMGMALSLGDGQSIYLAADSDGRLGDELRQSRCSTNPR